jgi:nitronate monooxygenase
MAEPSSRPPRAVTSTVLDQLEVPIVLAPMAGGPGTPQLAAAVCDAGGLGFLAAGYLSPDQLTQQIGRLRADAGRPFGVNLFAAPSGGGDQRAVADYLRLLAPIAEQHGVALGRPTHDDDDLPGKIRVVLRERPAVVSFTFGPPSPETLDQLHRVGIEVWLTVTDATEAILATALGVDALIAQGAAAGGHRGTFIDHDDEPIPLAELLAALTAPPGHLPVVAAGGIMDGTDLARALDAGAVAGQMGTAFLLCPEAGTVDAHRRALLERRDTTLTRAFSGRRARSIVNTWTTTLGRRAPSAYPEIHHVTAPLRAHGRATGNLELMSLWAGTGHPRARALPAPDLLASIVAELGDRR